MEYSVSSVLSLISHVHSLAADFLQKELKEQGLPELSSSHGFILFCLSKTESLSMGELSQKINRDKSTATALVKKLCELGLVQIHKSREDSRKKLLSLTEKGKVYNEITGNISQKLLTLAYRNFDEGEKSELLSLLCKLSGNLE